MQIFPRWTNNFPGIFLIAVFVLIFSLSSFIWYYGSPYYTDVGYAPSQPVPYSHKLHAGDMGIDCRYCHVGVEQGYSAVIPPTETCMGCHTYVKTDSEKLKLVRESWETGKPIEWIKVHMLPEYAYFNHSAHVNSGVACISCHGNIAEMEVVYQVQPLSMDWCLDCHRSDAPEVRPVSEVTNMYWTPPADYDQFVSSWVAEHGEERPVGDCQKCHR